MPSLALLQRQLWVSSRKLAEKHLGHARQLISSQEPADIHTAISLLDTVLKLFPHWEKAIELKARALLCLRRFKDVANLLQDFIPSLKAQTNFLLDNSLEKEKVKLLASYSEVGRTKKASLLHCFSLFPLKTKLWVSFSKKGEKDQWRYIVLGQACCHLGMMEDAMILLSNGKRAASAACRKQSNCLQEDSFVLDTMLGSDTDLVSHLLGNIKLLLRRRTAALAALDAGLYTEAARHFSKIIDGRRGTPQGFIAECYMHRAIAYQAANRIVDAIADCNRTLALNPFCVEALSTRATLFEIIGCFSDCLQDLEHLKALYETVFRNYNMQEPRWLQHPQSTHDTDFQGCIDYICCRLTTIRERVNAQFCNTVDYHRILGISRSCSRVDVERAYLLLSLKHRPDKAAHFVDRCEFVDERDIEVVKDEARSLGLKLFRLIQRAYTCVMDQILEEEMRRERNLRLGEFAHESGGLLPLYWGNSIPSAHGTTGLSYHVNSQSCYNTGSVHFSDGDAWLDSHGIEDGEIFSSGGSKPEGSVQRNHAELDVFPALESLSNVGHLVEANLFPQTTTCRELASVGSLLSQGLTSEAWMGSNEWTHQAHSPHPLSVT